MITERESAGGSLFERIRQAAKPPVRRKPKEALLRSIRNNLRDVLNTRTGSCHGSPELGITDFNDGDPASVEPGEAIKHAISRCILRYEPRISDVTVTKVGGDGFMPLELHFHIVATMDFSDSRDVVEFDILLDNHQHWNVE
ncbi:type VI secretion system baseplate subunit TssE [Citrobacter freundii]|uniref:type VI secretion system baseplate subunit TssE n=1 Tax=Citrobacter freundii TaxID=546 RepID=UPI0025A6F663|nr:type VI secretion system baseplate subunit TssE [Citrobacter freundii]